MGSEPYTKGVKVQNVKNWFEFVQLAFGKPNATNSSKLDIILFGIVLTFLWRATLHLDQFS